ncbi:hypothetical protein TeGR_g11764 [Tetraparma gracilis]|uniref:Uncharacterized protein n=1 Tax=Tetraparma gracilis TaxID=2962635 RepID=A0ABQ6NBJ6_9STRA|nr:hypothetical protein TeGR_g11764 [Tetraparma gracilis]
MSASLVSITRVAARSAPRFQQIVPPSTSSKALHLAVAPSPQALAPSLLSNARSFSNPVPLDTDTSGNGCPICEAPLPCDLCQTYGKGNVQAVFTAPIMTNMQSVSFVTKEDLTFHG